MPVQRCVRLLLAVVLAALGCFLLLALTSFEHRQVAGTAAFTDANLCGHIGGQLAHLLIGSWGIVAWLLPILTIGYAVALLRGKRLEHLGTRLAGAILLIPVLCGLFHLLPANPASEHMLLRWDQPPEIYRGGLGGALGHLLTHRPLDDAPDGVMIRLFGAPGSLVLLLAMTTACVIMMQLNLTGYARRILNRQRQRREEAAARRQETTALRRNPETLRPPSPPPITSVPRPITPTSPIRRETTSSSDHQAAIDTVHRHMADPDSTGLEAKDLVERIRQRRRELDRATSDDEPDDDHDEDDPVSTTERLDEARIDDDEDGRNPPPHAPAAESEGQRPAPPPRPRRRQRRAPTADGYQLPAVDLLEPAPPPDHSRHDEEVAQTSQMIETLFQEHRIAVRVVRHTRGPVITQYELELQESGLRVNRLEGFEKDLSLKLGCEGIRIVAPLPNKRTVGVEVPNRLKEAVVMRDLVTEIDLDRLRLPLVIGRDVLGQALLGDLAVMPHLLIAGATGMGKSVCLNAIICSMLLFRGPDEVKFILVDPKQVELAGYENIPHLLTPPITDMAKAHAALEWACATMDERFYLMRLAGARDIGSYNALGQGRIEERLREKGKSLEDLPGIPDRMPYIVIIVDEYADLMMINKEVEKSLVRLTAKARACGIHVILTTQRPSADVVTGLIKSNLPSRICFRVADKSNSRVVLDQGGAENLLGRGDMLYLPPGISSLMRGQGVWVKDAEIEAIVAHACSQGEPEYDDSICKVAAVSMAGGGASGDADASAWLQDRQFHEGVWAMFRYNKTGADFLRRKLNIGYNRATQYVEQMEDLGILGPARGTKPRELIKTWEDWLTDLQAGGLSWDEDDDIYVNPLDGDN